MSDDTAPLARDRTVRTALLVLAGAAALLVLRYARDVLVPVVLAILISRALEPLVARLRRWRVPRTLGAALVVLTLVGSGTGIVYSLQDDAITFVQELPKAAQKLRGALRSMRRGSPIDEVQRAATELERAADEAAGPAPSRGATRVVVTEPALPIRDYLVWGSMGAVGMLTQAVMIMFLVFFILVSGDLYERKLVKIAGPSTSRQQATREVLDEINVQVQRYLLVEGLTAVLVGLATWLALAAIGLQQAGVWGVAAGVLNTVPYFGPVIVSAALLLVAFLQFGTLRMAVYASAIALAVTSLEGWLLRPALFGRATRTNHVAVFVGLLFWGWLWGLIGVLLAVPMLTITKAICDRIETLRPLGELIGN